MKANEIVKIMAERSGNSPPTPEQIAITEQHIHMIFPNEYKIFISTTDGFRGEIGDIFIRLYGIASVAKAFDILRHAYEEFLVFGTDGGDEYFAFDRRVPSCPIVNFCTGDTEKDAKIVARDFDEFLEKVYAGTPFSWSKG